MASLENGELDFEDLTISAIDELISKLSFSREGEHWESTSTPEHLRALLHQHRVFALLPDAMQAHLADALVIEAMRTLSAAEVVADTNAYIVLATAMSLVVFRQRTQWQERAVAAGVVCSGLACIGVGRSL